MIVETYKVNLTDIGRGEAYDHNHWEVECDHVIHIFQLLLEQLEMKDDDSLCFFDAPKPGAPQVWKMYSYNSTFQVVAELVEGNNVPGCQTGD